MVDAKPPDPPEKEDARYVSVSLIRQGVGPLTYRVPPALSELVRAGVRVAVPLSRTRATGYVLGDAAAPDHATVREVLDVLDPEPLLTEAQLHLASFAARYYLYPLSETLRLLHPAGMDLVERRTLAITEEGRLALEHADGLLAVQGLELTPAERQVLTILARGEAGVAALRKRVPQARHQHLLGLQRRGLVREAETRYAPKVKVVTEEFASLVPDALVDLDRDRLQRSARVQAGILDALEEAGEALPLSALRERHPGVRPSIKRLVERGLVTLEVRERLRDPFAGVDVKPHPPPELNLDQTHAVAMLSAARREGGFQPFLLHGVTSSGKTEVYLRVIREALDAGQGAIVLVPEISLTPQLAGRFRARFPEGVAVLHSGLGQGQREDEWRRVRRGDVRLVVGARSALFAPMRNLGVLVVDEEHDGSFKQEEGLRYHARNLALVRGQQESALVILGSATPSLESYQNARDERMRLIQLPRRATPQPLPAVEVVDLRKYRLDEDGVLTAPLAEALTETLTAGQQAIIFLNRRGFAPFVLCRDCGEPVRCRDCSVTLTLHKRQQRLVCHYCGLQQPPPRRCPNCDGDGLQPLGLGTERVEDSLRARFPGARIGRLDRDTARGARLQQILDATAAGELDILVGTQMVTKGHDFPGVTLVGVINADQALHLPDFRSAERTFQLLSQVAGRAGRGGVAGRVIIQTYNPDHHAIEHARTHDYVSFFEAESRFRRELGYPPLGHLVALRIEGPEEKTVVQTANRLAARCHEEARPFHRDRRTQVVVLGPVEAPIARIRGRFRWQILLKSADRPSLHAVARAAQAFKGGASDAPRPPKDIRILIDVDPQSML